MLAWMWNKSHTPMLVKVNDKVRRC